MQQPVRQMPAPLERLRQEAVARAVAGEWAHAIRLNRELLAADPSDIEACNRLGKALSEVGRMSQAIRAYERALNLDPNNRIALRNVERLRERETAGQLDARVAPSAEMQRVMGAARGASIATSLVRTAPRPRLESVRAGDRLRLRPSDAGIRVYAADGDYLGTIEPRLSRRIARLSAGGNRYDAAAADRSSGELSVHVIEAYRSPEQAHVASFPPRFNAAATADPDIDAYEVGDDAAEGQIEQAATDPGDEGFPERDSEAHALLNARVVRAADQDALPGSPR